MCALHRDRSFAAGRRLSPTIHSPARSVVARTSSRPTVPALRRAGGLEDFPSPAPPRPLNFPAARTEHPLLASIPAVGIVVPQLLWALDFGSGLFGLHPIGMTEYMFRESIPLFARGLSLFHGWLPFLLLWLVYRLGYDRRAFMYWTALGWTLMLICYFFMPAPPAPVTQPKLPVNINYVFGPSDTASQVWMAPSLYLLTMMAALPAVLWAPDPRSRPAVRSPGAWRRWPPTRRRVYGATGTAGPAIERGRQAGPRSRERLGLTPPALASGRALETFCDPGVSGGASAYEQPVQHSQCLRQKTGTRLRIASVQQTMR